MGFLNLHLSILFLPEVNHLKPCFDWVYKSIDFEKGENKCKVTKHNEYLFFKLKWKSMVLIRNFTGVYIKMHLFLWHFYFQMIRCLQFKTILAISEYIVMQSSWLVWFLFLRISDTFCGLLNNFVYIFYHILKDLFCL